MYATPQPPQPGEAPDADADADFHADAISAEPAPQPEVADADADADGDGNAEGTIPADSPPATSTRPQTEPAPSPAAASGGWLDWRAYSFGRSSVFNVSLAYNFALHDQKTRPWWSRVSEAPECGVLLGAMPFCERDHLARLIADEGVVAVLTMNEEFELEPGLMATPVSRAQWADAGVAQMLQRAQDFQPPSVAQLNECCGFIEEHAKGGGTVYVHCKAGRGRSTVAVLAFLMKCRGMGVDEAVAHVLQRRPHIRCSRAQLQGVVRFAASLGICHEAHELQWGASLF